MHELSIALSIVEIAEDAVRQAGAREVERIELQIGQLAGVEIPALDFAWSEAVRHTVLESATRDIEEIAGAAHCLECGAAFAIERPFAACPTCQSPFIEIDRGKELRVQAITVR